MSGLNLSEENLGVLKGLLKNKKSHEVILSFIGCLESTCETNDNPIIEEDVISRTDVLSASTGGRQFKKKKPKKAKFAREKIKISSAKFGEPNKYYTIVDSANANGLGISSLKGAYVKNVYMHTSQTPATGNPNPASGYIMMQLTDNFNSYINGFTSLRATTSGSNLVVTAVGAALTIGQLYVISAVGTTTTANWVSLGVPVGVTPAVGVAFIAAATGAGTGSGTVQLPKATGAGIIHIEMVGSANTSVAPRSGVSTSVFGSYFYFQCLGATNSSTTTLVKTAPADGTIIDIQLLMSNSSLQINGM